jgi:hypothetical protein
MYKEIRKKKKRKRETFQDVKLAQTRGQNLSMSKIDHLQQVTHIFPKH